VSGLIVFESNFIDCLDIRIARFYEPFSWLEHGFFVPLNI